MYPPSILCDGGRLSPIKTEYFKNYVSNKEHYLSKIGITSHEGPLPELQAQSSQQEPGIWAADLVAGSFQYKYKSRDPYYADLLKTKYITTGERVYWENKK